MFANQVFIKGNLLQEIFMVKEHSAIQMEEFIRVNG